MESFSSTQSTLFLGDETTWKSIHCYFIGFFFFFKLIDSDRKLYLIRLLSLSHRYSYFKSVEKNHWVSENEKHSLFLNILLVQTKALNLYNTKYNYSCISNIKNELLITTVIHSCAFMPFTCSVTCDIFLVFRIQL